MNKCDKEMADFIRERIYKNKVVIFGGTTCKATENAINLFKENYNHTPEMVYTDNLNFRLKECLVHITKDNIIPKVFITGIFAGNYKQIEMNHERRDFDILFKY
jgi:hypothetical protein